MTDADQSSVLGIILAAGRSTRMKTELPKVMHEVSGRPMLAHVIDACRAAGIRKLCVVVGYGKDMVVEYFGDDPEITWVDQTEQKGTGHAVQMCANVLRQSSGDVVIIAGDMPLVRSDTLQTLVRTHRERRAAVTLATAVLENPAGYGRILRDAAGRLRGIVEHRDCSPEQLAIREVNPSYYCFRIADLLSVLFAIRNDNAKGEFYITDTLGLLIAAGRTAEAVTAVAAEDAMGVNSRQELADINDIMRRRVLSRWMDSGVTIIDPATTWIDPRATIGGDTVVEPFTYIAGAAVIGRNCRIGPFACVAPDQRLADWTTLASNNGEFKHSALTIHDSALRNPGGEPCRS